MLSERCVKVRAHGTYAKYKREGCHCDPCHEVGTRKTRQLAKRRAMYGPAYIDATPARAHCEGLRAAGMTNAQIAAAATVIATQRGWPAVNRTQVRAMLDGQALGNGQLRVSKGVRPTTAAALLAVQARDRGTAPDVMVDSTGTRRRVSALGAIGWSRSEIARRLGYAGDIPILQIAKGPVVRAATAEAVRALYLELRDTDGPCPATATRWRGRGALPPAYYDDDTIDDPDWQPAATDRVAIARTSIDLTRPRHEHAHALARAGLSPAAIATALGTTAKNVRRDLARTLTVEPSGTPGTSDELLAADIDLLIARGQTIPDAYELLGIEKGSPELRHIRLQWVEDLTRLGGSAEEIGERLGLHPRQIARDLATLRSFGVDVASGRHGGVHVDNELLEQRQRAS